MTWFYILSVIVPILSFFLFKWSCGSMSFNKLSIVSFIYYFWLMFVCYVGVTMIVIGADVYFINNKTTLLTLQVFYAVSYVLLTLPIGVKIASILFKKSPKERLDNFYSEKQNSVKSYNYKFWIFCLVISIASGLYTTLYVPEVPFFKMLTGASEEDLLRARFTSKFEFTGVPYIKNLLFHVLSVLCSFVFFNIYLRNRNNFNYLFLTIISISWGIYSEGFNGEKAPLVFYLIALVLNYYIITGKKIGVIQSLKIGLISFLGVMVMYFLVSGEVHLSLTAGLIGRIVFVPTMGLFLTFLYFPEQIAFLNGASFPNWIVSSFGLEHQRSARAIMELRYEDGVDAGTAGVMNTLFVGEAYANFGQLGLMISPFFVGFIVGLIHNWIIRKPGNYLSVALMVYFMMNVPIVGGFVDFVWNVSWFFLGILIFAGRKLNFSSLRLHSN